MSKGKVRYRNIDIVPDKFPLNLNRLGDLIHWKEATLKEVMKEYADEEFTPINNEKIKETITDLFTGMSSLTGMRTLWTDGKTIKNHFDPDNKWQDLEDNLPYSATIDPSIGRIVAVDLMILFKEDENEQDT